jgi:hypothetical protein
MTDTIAKDRQPVAGTLDELRRQVGSFCAIVEEHLNAAQQSVNATGATDHAALMFIDACADIIWNHRAPFFVRAAHLTELLAARENVVINQT